MKLPEPPFLRELNRGDEQECNLVLKQWLTSYVGTKEMPSSVDLTIERGVMYKLYYPLVRERIARSTVVVACMPEAPDTIYGWVCFDGDTVHYIAVKGRWKRLGIATWLLRDFLGHAVQYTHDTAEGRKLLATINNTAPWHYSPMARFQEAA